MAYYYPYASEQARQAIAAQKQGAKIEEWHKPGNTLQQIITDLSGPILEIAGPTDSGYYFLDSIELPSSVIITNITHEPAPFAPNKAELATRVEQIIDGRRIPYGDATFGAVLAAHLSIIDDHEYDFSNLSDDEGRQLSEQIVATENAERLSVKTGTINEEVIRLSLRFGVAKEVFRVLKPGGLYITDATPAQAKLFEMLGYEKIAWLNLNSIESEPDVTEPYFELVLQKPVGK